MKRLLQSQVSDDFLRRAINFYKHQLFMLRHYFFVIRRRPKKYVYWTRCFHSTERCLYRDNRWTGAFDQWIDGKWVDKRDIYWRIISDEGYITSWRRARMIRKELSRGKQSRVDMLLMETVKK